MLIWHPLVEASLPNDFSSTKLERCFDQRTSDEQDRLFLDFLYSGTSLLGKCNPGPIKRRFGLLATFLIAGKSAPLHKYLCWPDAGTSCEKMRPSLPQ